MFHLSTPICILCINIFHSHCNDKKGELAGSRNLVALLVFNHSSISIIQVKYQWKWKIKAKSKLRLKANETVSFFVTKAFGVNEKLWIEDDNGYRVIQAK